MLRGSAMGCTGMTSGGIFQREECFQTDPKLPTVLHSTRQNSGPLHMCTRGSRHKAQEEKVPKTKTPVDRPRTREAVVMQRYHRRAAATGSACQFGSSQSVGNTGTPTRLPPHTWVIQERHDPAGVVDDVVH